ncbi:hypothetical protein LP52_06580 [Streptomonospora alba]|uniref:Cytochrome P450 n=1 Tax=Streptomonospora alba TaxID=183763 RepID=A0A0C2JRU7_9ACTN|nr:cytochrome P450 [Streptomonospora alba]KIH99547.1 hypothetical protein LP52_06580 [Streptomonospora alba]
MTITTRRLPFEQPHPMQPPPGYAELRETEPVAPVTTSDGRPAWLVTSYDAVADVLSDSRFGVTRPADASADNGTLLQDGEAHARLRRLIGKAFTPRRVEALRPRVERMAADRVADLASSGPPADLVTGLAAPLSITVISELLGVAIEERERFRELADAASAADFLSPDEAPETVERVWGEFGGHVAELVAAKRRDLGDDLISDLITVHDTDDGRLDDYELVTLALTILASGYLTACNAVSVGAILLITEGRLPALAADPDRTEAAVEEIVRLEIGLIGDVFPRWAHEDVELAGVPISAGDLVLVRLGAANRDPKHFAEPDRFLPGRSAGPHLAFGRGPHHCLGAALARLEVGAVLRELAQHLPDLRLQGSVHDIAWARGHADVGPTAVHVTW